MNVEYLVRLAEEVKVDSLDRQVLQEQGGLQANKVQGEKLDQQVLRDPVVNLEHLEEMANQDHLDHLVQEEKQDFLDHLVPLAKPVHLDKLAHLVPPALEGNPDQPVHLEHVVKLDQLDHQVKGEKGEKQALLALREA